MSVLTNPNACCGRLVLALRQRDAERDLVRRADLIIAGLLNGEGSEEEVEAWIEDSRESVLAACAKLEEDGEELEAVDGKDCWTCAHDGPSPADHDKSCCPPAMCGGPAERWAEDYCDDTGYPGGDHPPCPAWKGK